MRDLPLLPIWSDEQLETNSATLEMYDLFPLNQKMVARCINLRRSFEAKKIIEAWGDPDLRDLNSKTDFWLSKWNAIRTEGSFGALPCRAESVLVWRALRELFYFQAMAKAQNFVIIHWNSTNIQMSPVSHSKIINASITDIAYSYSGESQESKSRGVIKVGEASATSIDQHDAFIIGYGIPDFQRRVVDVVKSKKTCAVYLPVDSGVSEIELSGLPIKLVFGPKFSMLFSPHFNVIDKFRGFPREISRFLTWMSEFGVNMYQAEVQAVEDLLHQCRPKEIHIANHSHPSTCAAIQFGINYDIPIFLYEHSEHFLRKTPFCIDDLIPINGTRVALNSFQASLIRGRVKLSRQSLIQPSFPRRCAMLLKRALRREPLHVFCVSTGQSNLLSECNIADMCEKLNSDIKMLKSKQPKCEIVVRLRDHEDSFEVFNLYLDFAVSYSLQSEESIFWLLQCASTWTEVGLPSSATVLASSFNLQPAG